MFLTGMFFLLGCSTTPQIVLTDINHISGVIYCEHSEHDEFTRYYYIKSEACTGMGGTMIAPAIYSIPGVAAVYPSAYKIGVSICPVYEWSDIEPEIISRINQIIEAVKNSSAAEPEIDKSQGL